MRKFDAKKDAWRADEGRRGSVFEISSDGMLILDLDGAVQSVNPAAIGMLGALDEAALLGARWPLLWAEADRPAADAALRSAVAGERQRFVAPAPTRTNRLPRLEAIVSPLRDAAGAATAVLVTLHDVSELEDARLAAEAREQVAIREALALQAVADRAYLSGWTLDFRTNVVRFAEAGAQWVRSGERDVPLERLLTMYGSQEQARIHDAIEGARCGQPFKFDARFTRFDGEAGWVRLSGEPIYEDGECVGIRGAGMEISEEMAAREKIEDAQKRLYLASQLAGVEVFELDVERRLLIEEGSLASILGAPPPVEDLWSDPLGLVDPQDRRRVQRQWTAAQAAGTPFRCEFRVRRADGQLVWIYGAAEFIGDGGRPRRLIGAIVDITERKRSELQLLRTMAEMREHEAQQKLLLDELNHRVKNTLAAVQSVAMQTLTNARDPQEGRELFIERLLALSATHDLLVKRAWASASFRELVEALLKPYG
ncbi:MAG TPA: HWE histidine kinase domain-containing protein, partial [Phenylobacterium sp.]|uniref:HWE histidine kinase domain-containing protein n=1 Tax=Phenylobacterium sp. TaxID=1871053 RepID=UPI002B4A86B9